MRLRAWIAVLCLVAGCWGVVAWPMASCPARGRGVSVAAWWGVARACDEAGERCEPARVAFLTGRVGGFGDAGSGLSPFTPSPERVFLTPL